jgi:hypothetical protein
MIERFSLLLFFLLGIWLVSTGPVFGQGAKAWPWTHGLEMKARKADEKEFSDKTRNFGGEAYVDGKQSALVYFVETGSVAALPAAGFTAPKEIKAPKWLAAMNLSVRKAGEAKFSDTTKKIGVEVFVDENTGARLYLSETGSIGALRGGPAGASAAGPKHQYGYELRVRKGAEGDFTDKTQKYGVEVFLDEAGSTLIYVADAGAIAVTPAAPIAGGGEVKKPDWMFGLNLKVRKAGEKDFTDATRKWGIEVFKDDKAGNLIYIGENGDLAVVPAGNFARPQQTKTPTWLHDQDVRVRRGGEKEFTDKTRKWGVEVFRDENTNNAIYITEAGALAVLPPK